MSSELTQIMSGRSVASRQRVHGDAFRTAAEECIGSVTPEHVRGVIDQLDEDYDTEWKQLGMNNLYRFMNDQGKDPVRNFIEHPSNSADGILERIRWENGFPDSVFEGRSKSEMRQLIKEHGDGEISIVSDSPTEDSINLTTVDDGIGATPDEFESRFFGPVRSGDRKSDIPYTLGQYGLGSTAMLQFCRKDIYKFVLTASVKKPGEWSWSVIGENPHDSGYAYLTIDGETPSFSGPLGSHLGGAIDDATHGTVAKLYDYDAECNAKAIYSVDNVFAKRFERAFPVSTFDVHLCRFDPSAEQSLVRRKTNGLVTSIEDCSPIIEDDQTRIYTVDDPIGDIPIRVITCKQRHEVKEMEEEEGLKTSFRKPRIAGSQRGKEDGAVLYHVMGQVHAVESFDVLKGTCNLKETAKDALVLVDITDLPSETFDEIFGSDRSNITTNSEEGELLRSSVLKALR